MKKILFLLLIISADLAGQTLRNTIDANILNQGSKGITSTKLRGVLVTVADSVSNKVNKTGGVMSGGITATNFVKSGGTSGQFLKADGSVDDNSYIPVVNNSLSNSISYISGSDGSGGKTKIEVSNLGSGSINSFLSYDRYYFGGGDWNFSGNILTAKDGYFGFAGNSSPTASIDLGTSGTLKIGSSAGANKLLTSDASGNATWQTPAFVPNSGTKTVAGATTFTNDVKIDYEGADFTVRDSEFNRSIRMNPESGFSFMDYAGLSTYTEAKIRASNIKLYTPTGGIDILGNGNVGIGTISPTQKIHVAGYGRFDSGVIGGSSGLTIYGSESSVTGMFLNASGNLGIGTITPTATLDINGFAKLKPMTTTEINAIVSPVNGLIAYNSDLGMMVFYSTSWKRIVDNSAM